MTQKSKPWFADKRAQAYVYALLADRDVIVRDQTQQDYGLDLIIHLCKHGRETGQSLAILVKPYLEIPSVNELNAAIVELIPQKISGDLMIPVVVFVVQVRHLEAIYTWINEPEVKSGTAALTPPFEFAWHKLDDSAMKHILERVEKFWEALLKPALNGHHN